VPTEGEWRYALQQTRLLLILALLTLFVAIVVTIFGPTLAEPSVSDSLSVITRVLSFMLKVV
jgi:hypothetical protein